MRRRRRRRLGSAPSGPPAPCAPAGTAAVGGAAAVETGAVGGRGRAALDGCEPLLERRQPLVELLSQPRDLVPQCLRGGVLRRARRRRRLGERWRRADTAQRQRPVEKVQCFHGSSTLARGTTPTSNSREYGPPSRDRRRNGDRSQLSVIRRGGEESVRRSGRRAGRPGGRPAERRCCRHLPTSPRREPTGLRVSVPTGFEAHAVQCCGVFRWQRRS